MEQKKEHQKLYAENIKYKDKLKQQQDHDQQEYKWQKKKCTKNSTNVLNYILDDQKDQN